MTDEEFEDLRKRLFRRPATVWYVNDDEPTTITTTTATSDYIDITAREASLWKQYTDFDDTQLFDTVAFWLGNKLTIEEAGLIPEEYETSWDELMGGQNGSR